MVFIKHNSLKSVIFFNPIFIPRFQDPCFSGSRFFRVQVFLGPGFSRSRSRVRVQVLEVAYVLNIMFLYRLCWLYINSLLKVSYPSKKIQQCAKSMDTKVFKVYVKKPRFLRGTNKLLTFSKKLPSKFNLIQQTTYKKVLILLSQRYFKRPLHSFAEEIRFFQLVIFRNL